MLTLVLVAATLGMGLMTVQAYDVEPPSDSKLLSNEYNLKTHGLDNQSLLSNGYDVKNLYNRMLHDGIDIKSLITNHIIGETDPEISCIGSCSLMNLTQVNENAEEERKAIDKTEEGYMKSLTEGSNGSEYTSSSNDTENLIKGLMQTGKFTEEEARQFVK